MNDIRYRRQRRLSPPLTTYLKRYIDERVSRSTVPAGMVANTEAVRGILLCLDEMTQSKVCSSIKAYNMLFDVDRVI